MSNDRPRANDADLLKVKQFGELQREILLWLARWDKDEVRTPETIGEVLGRARQPEALRKMFEIADTLRAADLDGEAELLAYSKDPEGWLRRKEQTEKQSRERRKGAAWLSTELLDDVPSDQKKRQLRQRSIHRALKKLDEKYGMVQRRAHGDRKYTSHVRLTLQGRKAAQLIMLERVYIGDLWRDLKEALQDA